MKKILTILIGFFIYSCSLSVNAQSYTLSPGIDVNMDFPPGIANELSNPLFWSTTIRCSVSAPEPQTLMRAKAIKKGVIINGQNLIQGQTQQISVANESTLIITVDGRAKIELTNLSEHLLNVKCTA